MSQDTPIISNVCPTCNTEFLTDDRRRKFCGPRCQRKAMVARANKRVRAQTVALDKETKAMIDEVGMHKNTFVRLAVKAYYGAWKKKQQQV